MPFFHDSVRLFRTGTGWLAQSFDGSVCVNVPDEAALTTREDLCDYLLSFLAKGGTAAVPATLLAPVDDLPPATVILSARKQADGKLLVRGVTQDNGDVTEVTVNGQRANFLAQHAGVTDWEITVPAAKEFIAVARDAAGNVERNAHKLAQP